MNEYDCWFQKGRAIEPLKRELLDRIGVDSGEPDIAQALSEYCWGMETCFGLSVHMAEVGSPHGRAISRIGTISHLNKMAGLSLPTQGPEGFVIRVTDTSVVIAGQDGPGTLYGVYRFLALLALGSLKPGLEIAETPTAPIRMINHWDNMDGSVERGYAGPSLFFKDDRLDYEELRIKDYARLLASVGINRLSINNVNVRGAAKRLITKAFLDDVAALAAIFRPFGIRLLISINFSAPHALGETETADPLEPAVAAWWRDQAALVYRYIPDLAGFLVKADSEGESGPFQYGRTHAEGANMLADALRPHGGDLVWRCFVYNSGQDWRDHSIDRPRAAYDHFKALDGSFADNVLLQIKFGPVDFQVREPVSPLFGALTKTRHLMELQITQEYTGHQIDLCYLPWMWKDVMDFDTARGPQSRIKDLLGSAIDGLAAVGNVGLDKNWTGHTLAQANLYGYGRIAWNPSFSPKELAGEWCTLSFGKGKAGETIQDLLLASYPAYEKYNAPFGVGFMVTPQSHYGPSVEGYEFSRWGTYHRADHSAIGINRTAAGTGYASQYTEQNATLFSDPTTCPENLLLFFHRLRYDFVMKNGQTLLQNIYDIHFEGCQEAEAMLETWKTLQGFLDDVVYHSVLSRLERQVGNAREWRDVINTYFYRRTGIGDKKGRHVYD
jgi:alpha-glucuronidase